MPISLKNRVALVTGGAGGIGAAICHGLAAAGVTVIVGYNSSRDSAQALVQDLPATAHAHSAMTTSVTDNAAMQKLAQHIENQYGRCDIVVNCVGTTRYVAHDDLDGLDDGLIDQILATNIRGPFATVRALRALLDKSGDGLVINISSIAAQTAVGSNVVYCASKAALDNMTKSLARALAPNIRVLSVSPGLVDTAFVKSMNQVWRDQQAHSTPLQRLAEPSEVANAVVAVATHLTFTTGAIIPVDGGRPLI